MTEAELQDGIATAAQCAGWKVMHVRPARTADGGWRSPVQYDGRGWPDLFMAHPDCGVMAIECKSVRGRLTGEQSAWLDTLAAAGVPGGGRGAAGEQWRDDRHITGTPAVRSLPAKGFRRA